MPSLVYIARIKNFSEELAQTLRSAGCHVKSFEPGAITHDECLLAMTSEAVDAALHHNRARPQTGRDHSPLPDIKEHFGADAAVWNCLETTVAGEFSGNRQPIQPATVETETANQKSAPEVRQRTAPVEKKPIRTRAVEKRPVEKIKPGKPSAETEHSPAVAVSSPAMSPAVSSSIGPATFPSIFPRKNLPAIEQIYKVLRNPLSTVVVILAFAAIYRGLPATTASPLRSASHSVFVPALSAEPSRQAGPRGQQHPSEDGFVAEDFTRRLTLRAGSESAQKTSELKHPQRDSTQKRIVVD